MRRVLVIGYGNPSRRDDGVGHYVIHRLQRLATSGIDTLTLDQLGPELAETLKDYDLVIFTDAHSDEYPEEVRVASIEAVYHPSAFSHSMSPSSLLALTKSLYHKEPQGFTVSIRGHDFDLGTELSEETQRGADAAVERILVMSGARRQDGLN